MRGTHAAVAIGELAAAAAADGRGSLDIVTLGPLTNLALAVRLSPALATQVGTVYMMGGAHTGAGNMTITSEYNMGMDPEAAAVVTSAFPRIVMVSWELTLKYPLPRAFVEARYLHGTGPVSTFLAAISAKLIAATGEADYNTTGLLIPDPLAAAIALAPAIVTASRRATIHVELAGTHTRGMTVADLRPPAPTSGAVEIVDALDFDALLPPLPRPRRRQRPQLGQAAATYDAAAAV